MSGYSKAELQVFYDTAKASYLKAMKSASMNLNGRGMAHQKLEALKMEMDKWRNLLDEANGESNGIRITQVVSKHG